MPTGYTAAVQDGSIKTFRAFALRCARAMMPCITMRDEPCDAPIPKKFEPNIKHNQAAGDEAQKRLLELLGMSDHEINIAATSHYEKEVEEFHRYLEQSELHRLRYKTMLEKVKAWNVPTSDHDGLKTFMVEQLQESISWDCAGNNPHPERSTATEWHRAQCEAAKHDIDHHNKSIVEEVNRVKSRNDWLQGLRESLGQI